MKKTTQKIPMKQKNPRGLFDEEYRLEKLANKKDPLLRLKEQICWKIFRPILDKVFEKEPKGKGGRPPFDYVLMFKILILQRCYNISDEQMEYQINDRLSFMRFLDLGLSDTIPDQNTIWLFKENLIKANVIELLFQKFEHQMEREGIIVKEGSIIDATIVDVPRQRNKRDENEQIKEGTVPKEWKKKPDKLRQKDTDAKWTKKNEVNYFGYKNHVKVCRKSKMIKKYDVTDASVHDSQVLVPLLEKSDSHHDLYADSAYSGERIKTILKKKNIRDRIHEKGYRGSPLTEAQQEKNRNKSKIRVRVEHVFGYMTNSMHGIYIRTIGKVRARAVIGLMNLTYNMQRYLQLRRVKYAK
jgi:transposase, IS5 family